MLNLPDGCKILSGAKEEMKFVPQKRNANKHNTFGLRLLEESLQRDGFIDAQTAAADGEIISGSARMEVAAEKFDGVEPIIVHSDGKRPVIVVRDDIPNAEHARARRLSVAANQIAKADFNPDGELLKEWAGEDDQIRKMFADDDWQRVTNSDYLGEVDSEEKKKADKVKGNVDLIYTAGTYGEDSALTHCCLAIKSGWLYGYQSKDSPCATSKIQKAHEVQFIDNNYFDFDWPRYIDAVKIHKPKYCTVRDVMTEGQCQEGGIGYHPLGEILDWAEELSQYSENVIVIPKFDCLDKIPEKFMLGYSIPTSHGGTPLPILAFKGRRVHLLGGSPNKQIQFFERIPESIVSLDNNYILKIANFGVAWCPDMKQRSLTDLGFGIFNNPLYVALAISLGNFAGYFNKKSIDGGIQDGTLGDID